MSLEPCYTVWAAHREKATIALGIEIEVLSKMLKQLENRSGREKRKKLSQVQVTRTCPPHVAEISSPSYNPKEKTTWKEIKNKGKKTLKWEFGDPSPPLAKKR